MLDLTWEHGLFAAVLLAAPALVFAAAVLLDHLLHGPINTTTERRRR